MKTRKGRPAAGSSMMIQARNDPPPPQPDERDWRFVKERQTPLHAERIKWERASPRSGEADLRAGVQVIPDFPDPDGRLDTAYADFRRFLHSAGIPEGAYPVRACHARTPLPETYRIVAAKDGCRILAGDTEGIRRGLVFLEDELLRSGGPFLKCGTIERRPVIRTRISRCFFGPINRPPKCRDELSDDVDYYPDEYLNRLAHDGINGLWLTITFRDTVPSCIIPEYGHDATRRLDKLQRTVNQCARYGIKIYVFCIEPAAFRADSPVLAAHPELGGHKRSGWVFFCTSTPKGRTYLEEATRTLFRAVPGLGGLVDISVGERATHCYSSRIQEGINCPHCARRKPWEVLADTLAAMERGMHAANPRAELISWPYSQDFCWGEGLTREAAGHVPKNVIFQYNFEAAARARQLGKTRYIGDYWLSYIGPSKLFRDCATAAHRHGNRVSAKLQVSVSHEVATVPFIPVPGNLYGKYRAMHQLGVSAAMQCWFFGNYPSFMTKAAGELSFAPFPASLDAFLLSQARRDWGRQASVVVKAWKYFQRAYASFPLNNLFGYRGPMHDGPVWPLYPEPVDHSLAPTWQICYGLSGDRIGECIGAAHTLEEILRLCSRMVADWNRGVALLDRVRSCMLHDPERLRDIGVARALGLQFRSGLNILTFYACRETMAIARGRVQQACLRRMKTCVEREIEVDKALLDLARADTRLGFHSEAEGYKYFPARIEWRMRHLRALLRRDLPNMEKRLRANPSMFADWTGAQPQGPAYRCRRLKSRDALHRAPFGVIWEDIEAARCSFKALHNYHGTGKLEPFDPAELARRNTTWKAVYDDQAIHVRIDCTEPDMPGLRGDLRDRKAYYFWDNDAAHVLIEPRRLWPMRWFISTCRGARWAGMAERDYRWRVRVRHGADGWSVLFHIPLSSLGHASLRGKNLRINVGRLIPQPQIIKAPFILHHWVAAHPPPRTNAFALSPSDYGWIQFR